MGEILWRNGLIRPSQQKVTLKHVRKAKVETGEPHRTKPLPERTEAPSVLPFAGVGGKSL